MPEKVKLVTFGEAIFRFSTERGERLKNARKLDFYLGGSELNVAVNFASLGGLAGWVSVIPEGAAGDLILDRLQDLRIDLSQVHRKGSGTGFYLVESATAPRPSRVPLRQKSCFSDEIKGLVDWKQALSGAWAFHSSGIAAGVGAREELITAMKAAQAQKVLVSYDCNFRRNVWTQEESKAGQKDLIPMADLLFCSLTDLELLFGVGEAQLEGFVRESELDYLVLSRRDSHSTYGVDVWTPKGRANSKRYHYEITDAIGVGDSMTAGFFHALSRGFDLQRMTDFAAAAGALKYSVLGDMALLSKDEVEELVSQGPRSMIR